MGKATKWLKNLLGMKKDRESVENTNSICSEKKEKRRWSFAKPAKVSGGLTQIPAASESESESGWLRCYNNIADSEKEQNKHAIAVAAATAAAADAAVAAAQAAVEVVRLTSQGKVRLYTGGRERLAAEKVQTVFRGFLARKALRALKGLVKLQALVRGYLVRKRAAETLHSMQALIRAQAGVRAQRARRSINNDYRHQQPQFRPRKSIERFDENRSEFHSKRLSSPRHDHSLNPLAESPKIVEIDTCGPKSRSRRITACMSDYGDYHCYHAVSSPLMYPVPARLSIPDCQNHQDFDWRYVAEDYKFATAQNTPRFSCSGRAYGPATPARSVCGDGYFRPYPNSPSYMANTQSFRAKTRSYSAPKQRPELGPKKRLSLNEVMESRSSFSGVRMQKPTYPRAQEDFGI